MGILSKCANMISDERNQLKMYSGQQRHVVCDCTSGDAVVADADLGCRFAKVDDTGIIKINYKADNGQERTEVLVANAGEIIKIQNITRVYRYYVGTTACTTTVYTDAGAAVVGIKLCY